MSASKGSTFYERYFVELDSGLSLALGALIVFGLQLGVGQRLVECALNDVRGALYGGVAGTAAALLGFAIAVLPLIQTLLALPMMRGLRKNKNVHDLFSTFLHAITALGLLTVLSLVAIVLDRDARPVIIFPYAVVVLATVAIWKLSRSILLLSLLLRIASQS